MSRDNSIDIAKGIAILAIVYGHCSGIVPSQLSGLLLSFDLPLFFILSGYFFRPTPLRDVFSKGNKHLVRPYVITAIATVVLCLLAQDYHEAGQKALGALMVNGGSRRSIIGRLWPYMGPTWFFMALYWCKVFYTWLAARTDRMLLWSLVISTVAILIGHYVINLPLGILAGCSGMIYYAMGDQWRRYIREGLPRPWLIAGLAVWALCSATTHLSLARFDMALWVLSMVSAYVGTYVVCRLSRHTPGWLQPFMLWVGKNTLLIICYHALTRALMLNVERYVLEPNGWSIGNIGMAVITFVVALGFPYLHLLIADRWPQRHTTQQ